VFGDEVLVEKYIPGREIQVAVMGDRALGAIEIRPRGRFYDYETKYTDGKAEHFMPAPIHADAYAHALNIALRAHRTLGCRGVSRSDLRYDDSAGEPGTFYLLEINTQPGMTPISLVPEIAADCGMDFPELVAWMVENAECDN
jgi:D-alanine-D-alanine ligase